VGVCKGVAVEARAEGNCANLRVRAIALLGARAKHRRTMNMHKEFEGAHLVDHLRKRGRRVHKKQHAVDKEYACSIRNLNLRQIGALRRALRPLARWS